MKLGYLMLLFVALIVMVSCTVPTPVTSPEPSPPSAESTIKSEPAIPAPAPPKDVLSMEGKGYIAYGQEAEGVELCPHGLAWDGQFLWVTNEATCSCFQDPSKCAQSHQSKYIFKVDPDSGLIIDKFRASSFTENGATYDGKYLWTTGLHNPNEILPPWEDPDAYELIYKYSIEGDSLSLVERYALPEPTFGSGMAITFDGEGNLWVSTPNSIAQLDLLPNNEADYHPGLEDVWSTRVVRSYTLVSEEWVIGGFEWINWESGREELIICGYYKPHTANVKYWISILDPARDFSERWGKMWLPGTEEKPVVGSWGIAWDSDNEILWTLADRIFRHARDSNITYLEPLFGEK